MKALILAAGYATRLYPLTENQPKPLLPIAGKPMLEHVIGKLNAGGGIDELFVVTNEKFAGHFEEWARGYTGEGVPKITVVNDHSTNDDNKLGAIGDLHYVVTQQDVDDDLIVVAGDNLFSESIAGFVTFAKEKRAPVLGVYDVKSLDEAKKYGVVDLDEEGRLLSFVEKPEEPASSLVGIALYYYPRSVISMIRQYIDEGNNPDQPGRLIQWLAPRTDVYTWSVPGTWYDIGSKETLAEADRIFSRLG